MSRSSLRLKQYRPISTDFSLGAVFGLTNSHQTSSDSPTAASTPSHDRANGSSNGVLLINCKSFIRLVMAWEQALYGSINEFVQIQSLVTGGFFAGEVIIN